MADQTSKDIIIELLDTMDFDGDKDAFAYELLTITRKQALLNLITSLPTEKRLEFENAIKNDDGFDEKSIFKVISEEEYLKEYQHVLGNNIKLFFQDVLPTLPEEKQESIKKRLVSFSQHNFMPPAAE